jgi:hypothetical protein
VPVDQGDAPGDAYRPFGGLTPGSCRALRVQRPFLARLLQVFAWRAAQADRVRDPQPNRYQHRWRIESDVPGFTGKS